MYFTSDLHLGHNVIVPKYRDFTSQAEHDNTIFDLFSKLTKRDVVTVVGDFIFDGPNYDQYIDTFNKFSCRIKLVMGNHDSKRLYSEPKFEVQLPLYSYKNMWVSHCPIHTQELRSRDLNIHGHLHGFNIMLDGKPDLRYFNVNLDNNSFKLVHLDQIKDHQSTLKEL